MPMSVKCKVLLYADDSALLVAGKDPKLIAEKLSNDLKSCHDWLVNNKLYTKYYYQKIQQKQQTNLSTLFN